MTRQLLLAASLFLAAPAHAEEAPSLADVLSIADAPMDELGSFLKADMSFAAAMRMISTITLPEPTPTPISSGPSVRVRVVMSEAAWEDKRAREAKENGSVYRPKR